jgi:hypothetical protein
MGDVRDDDRMPNSLTLRHPIAESVLLLVGSVMLFGLFADARWMNDILNARWKDLGEAALTALVAGFFVYLLLRIVLHWRFGLILSHEGIRVRSAFSDRSLRWDEVERITTFSTTESTSVTVSHRGGILILSSYGFDAGELAALLNRWRDRCLKAKTGIGPAGEGPISVDGPDLYVGPARVHDQVVTIVAGFILAGIGIGAYFHGSEAGRIIGFVMTVLVLALSRRMFRRWPSSK